MTSIDAKGRVTEGSRASTLENARGVQREHPSDANKHLARARHFSGRASRTAPTASRTTNYRNALGPLLLTALAGCQGVIGNPGNSDVAVIPLPDVPVTCRAVEITPGPNAVVATDGVLRFRATGGAGAPMFTIEGTANGATIDSGGGLRAGSTSATFDVVARDPRCADQEGRTHVEVRGPFDVTPHATWTQANGTLQFTPSGAVGDVHLGVVQQPAGDTRPESVVVTDADHTFHASGTEGVYQLIARDTGSGREIPLSVTVCSGTTCPQLQPAAPVLAVPANGRLRVDWTGGSGAFDATVTPSSAGTVDASSVTMYFVPAMGFHGNAQLAVRDRTTGQSSSVTVLVGEVLTTTPVARGSQSQHGRVRFGDVNADHHLDLVVGDIERGQNGFEAGGVLVYYGRDDGSFGMRTDGLPDAVIEGEHAGDHFGQELWVGDISLDGVDDIVVATQDADLGGIDRGAVYLFLGAASGITPRPERVLVGEDRNNHFGASLAVRDVNGDMAPDVIVTASDADNPFDDTCKGGRAYVFRNRNRPSLAGVTEPVPWQSMDLRFGLPSEGTMARCADRNVGAGRSMALADMDRDGIADLVVGAVPWSWELPEWSRAAHWPGAVFVYRGVHSDTAAFEPTPAWQIDMDASMTGEPRFAFGLDVVRENATAMAREALVIRSPDWDVPMHDGAGAFFVFDAGSLPAAAAMASDGTRPVTYVTLANARANFQGTEARWERCRAGGIGLEGATLDVDGDGRNEYLSLAMAGRVLVFDVFGSGDPPRGSLAPRPWDVPVLQRPSTMDGRCADIASGDDGRSDSEGFTIAEIPAAMGTQPGLMRWLAWRNESRNNHRTPYVGTLEYLAPNAMPLTARWQDASLARTPLPESSSADEAGSAVAIADVTPASGLETFVGAPGAHAPADGDELLTGSVEVIEAAQTSASTGAHLWSPTREADAGGWPIVALDFDGQPGLELAVGVPYNNAGGAEAPTECQVTNESGGLESQWGVWHRGEVRIYSYSGGRWVAKMRFIARGEQASSGAVRGMNPGMGRLHQNEFGTTISVSDFDGDGKDDLIVGRPGSDYSRGVDVILGRALPTDDMVFTTDDSGNQVPSPIITCEGVQPVTLPGDENDWDYPSIVGSSVGALGNLDPANGNCDDVAMSLVAGPVDGAEYRAGLVVGFNVQGSCGPTTFLHLVPSEAAFANNDASDPNTYRDDTEEQWNTQSRFGRLVAAGQGNLIDDSTPDLVFRDELYAPGRSGTPAVEIVSGRCIAQAMSALRSGSAVTVCASGASCAWGDRNEYFALAIRSLSDTCRRVVSIGGISQQYGRAIEVRDVIGGTTAELAIGVPDDSWMGDFAGTVRVYRDGDFTTPWLIAVGDIGERGALGASLAMARGGGASFLVAGSPSNTRHGLGVDVGAAMRWQLP